MIPGTSPAVPADPAVVAVVFAALFVAHQVADHWVQTDYQATHKGAAGWAGRLACLAHVATYTATAALLLLAVAWRTGLPLHPAMVAAGLAVSAISHYIADRRTPLRRIAEATRVRAFYNLNAGAGPGSGAYALDQSWHIGWLLIAALIIA